ncbi:MAG: DUF3093 domain-containing protein [Carbonactinosporaceae bacterium]
MSEYDERLWVPLRWWAVPGFFLWTLWLAYAAYVGPGAALAVTVLAAVVVAGTLVTYGGVRVRVSEGVLLAGRAAIPLSAVGEVRVLDAREARDLRGPGADQRAFLLLRGYVPTAVRVEIADPQDPTPYAYLSTRHPARLAAALDHARHGGPDGPGGAASGA